MSTLSGQLSFATVSRHLEEFRDFEAETLDLSAVERIDSAGAALLLELTRRAKAQGKTLQLTNANAQVKGLLRFFELDEVVALAD